MIRVYTKILFILFSLFHFSSFSAESDPAPRSFRACPFDSSVTKFSLVCKDVFSAQEATEAIAKLKRKSFFYEIDENSLTVGVILRPGEINNNELPFLCCEIQAPLDKVSDGLYLGKFRWDQMSSSLLDMRLLNISERINSRIRYVGSVDFTMPDLDIGNALIARSGLVRSDQMIRISSEDIERKISIFKGRSCLVSVVQCIVIYMADGESLSFFIKNSLKNKVVLDRFIFVGIHNSAVNHVETRIKELVYGIDPTFYEAYRRLATMDVPILIEKKEKPLRRYVAGFSNGGAWALDTLYNNPLKYDGAIVMSPGQWEFRKADHLPNRRIYIGAGLMETGVKTSSIAIAAGFRNRETLVIELYPPSGHSVNSWLSIWLGALTNISKTIP
jgi:hypothetical protein